MAVVFDFHRGIDANRNRDRFSPAVRAVHHQIDLLPGLDLRLDSQQIVDLAAIQVE